MLSAVVLVAVPLLLYLLCTQVNSTIIIMVLFGGATLFGFREVWYDTKRPDTREALLTAPRGEHEITNLRS